MTMKNSEYTVVLVATNLLQKFMVFRINHLVSMVEQLKSHSGHQIEVSD